MLTNKRNYINLIDKLIIYLTENGNDDDDLRIFTYLYGFLGICFVSIFFFFLPKKLLKVLCTNKFKRTKLLPIFNKSIQGFAIVVGNMIIRNKL